MENREVTQSDWLDQPVAARFKLDVEKLLWVLLLVLAVFSRLYILGARVQSHDENSHVYYSWRFEQGHGFQHDPLMHGPLQFHLLAASYFMFGDNDFTARFPAALFSISCVMFMWFYRRYLGRVGALLGGVMMLISPYVLYYGRYARNEAFIELFMVMMLWAMLRWLETGQHRYMYIITAVNVLHYTSKETSFIYTAQALVFMAGLFLIRVSQVTWPKREYRNRFLLAVIAALLLVAGLLVVLRVEHQADAALATPVIEGTTLPAEAAPLEDEPGLLSPPVVALLILFTAAVGAGLYFLARGYTLERLRNDRPLAIVLVMLALVLPQLAAFPVNLIGWKVPDNAAEVAALTGTDILHLAAFIVPLFLLSVVIGMLWNARQWWLNAAIWYGLFTLFYTTTFTNGAGFFTGLVGSLGYWLEQQGVERGSQPLYYYALIQVPVYEFLPMLGTWLAFGMAAWIGLRTWWRSQPAAEQAEAEMRLPLEDEALLSYDSGLSAAGDAARLSLPEDDYADRYPGRHIEPLGGVFMAPDYSAADDPEIELAPDSTPDALPRWEPAPVFALFGFWALTSLAAFTIAGERMPWLTVHITLPAILCTAWALGRLVRGIDWGLLRRENGWLVPVLLPVFFLSFFATLGVLLGPTPPFRGSGLEQLAVTSTFLLDLLVTLVTGSALFYLVRHWPGSQFLGYLTLGFFALLALLTTRTSIQANYYAYDNANELLVYAHSAPGVKTALSQIEEISLRTTDGLALAVAYDNETSYPYWWYLRNYSNAHYYGSTPSRALRDKPVILVGDANFGKIEPVVADLYERFDYIRLWWPNQDYYGLTWDSIRRTLTDPLMREAVWQIWLNRDYTRYGQLTGRDMSLPNWSPAARMRLYVRKDIAAKLWNMGVAPAEVATGSMGDPFDEKRITLAAVQVIGQTGTQPGQFQRPRDMAVAPDGSLYVADSDNHRIQHLTPQGDVLHIWGSFGDVAVGQAAPGQFNQPWGLAVGDDGSVYVADTWNHRIQKFTADGQFITTWGYFGQAEQPQAFWGPRDVAVRGERVYVTDTGNKRIAVFDTSGNFITQFGQAGMDSGQFDEPVGVAVDSDGLVYVADTWNQRIQVFVAGDDGIYVPLRSWDVKAWYGQSLDNKPFITVDNQGRVFAADPEGYRILQFTNTGEPVRTWGDVGMGADSFGLPASVVVAPDGSLWVVDAGNNRLMHFVLPEQ